MTTIDPRADDQMFTMDVHEAVALEGKPGIVLAGPVTTGVCRAGDQILLQGSDTERRVSCLGIELLNWGRSRPDWVSLRVSDVDLDFAKTVTRAVGPDTAHD